MPALFVLLPPLIAILFAIWKREVVIALSLGIWLAEGLLLVQQGFAWSDNVALWPLQVLQTAGLAAIATLERLVGVFQGQGDTRVLLFGLVVGALLELMQASGGVAAFVRKLAQAGLTNTKRKVLALPSAIGSLIFVETNLSVLSAGVVSQKLFDRYQFSRERLAYLVDSTCAPISALILINGWGAYLLGLLDDYDLENPVGVLAGTLPLNFYALLTLAGVWYTVLTTRVHGPMRKVEAQVADAASTTSTDATDIEPTRARYMLVPLVTLVCGVFFFMWYTGGAGPLTDIMSSDASGSSSVLWSCVLATVILILMLAKDKVFSYLDMVNISYRGMGKLLPVVVIMLLSFAIGDSCRALGTGTYVSHAVGEFLPVFAVAPLLFICAGVISFTTGTSWGTFALLVPVGIPLALTMGLPLPLIMASIIGGGVFGDHCSPISDTTIVSSLAAGCDHLQHVRTQLPYALVTGSLAILIYTIIGFFL